MGRKQHWSSWKLISLFTSQKGRYKDLSYLVLHSFPRPYFIGQLKQNSTSKWQLQWNAINVGHYPYNFLPIISANIQMNNIFKILFLANHGPLQSYFLKMGKLVPHHVCAASSPTHYIMYYNGHWYMLTMLKNMSHPDWLTYVLKLPTLSNCVIQCTNLIEKNNFFFQNHNPYFSGLAQICFQ